MVFEWKYIPAIKKKPCLSASQSRLLQGLSMSFKASTKPETSCLIPGSPTNWSLLPVSKDLQEPLLQSTSCQSHQPPRILPKTLPGKPQPWILRARLWEELPSSCWPPGQCLPGHAAQPCQADSLLHPPPWEAQTCRANLRAAVEARCIH